MAVKGLIFDMDGTLTLSMGYWREGLRRDICLFNGVPEEEIAGLIAEPFAWAELREKLTARNSEYADNKAFWRDTYAQLAHFYATEVEAVPGAVEFLCKMKEQGLKLGVATATPRHIASHALEHLEILPLLDAFISTKDLGVEKTEPNVYLECAKLMGLEKDETVIFEDALYCGRTLRSHGFTFIGIHDPTMPDENWAEFAPLCDRTVEDYTELL